MTHRCILALGSAVAAISSTASGQPAEEQRRFSNQWSFAIEGNYTDNFALLDDGEYVRRFVNPDGTFLTETLLFEGPDGEIVPVEVVVSDTVSLETQSKFFTTINLSGRSVYTGARLTGFVGGNLQYGYYPDEESFGEAVADDVNANLPQAAVDAGATPTIGSPGFDGSFFVPNLNAAIETADEDSALGTSASGFVLARSVGGQLGRQLAGNQRNDQIVGGVSASPRGTLTLRSGQEISAAASSSLVTSLDDADVADAVPSAFVNTIGTSTSTQAALTYATGQLFGRPELRVSLTGLWADEEATAQREAQTLEQYAVAAQFSMPFSRRLSGNVSVSYDELERVFEQSDLRDPATGELLGLEDNVTETSGMGYTAGLDYVASERSRASVRIGQRFGRFSVDGSAQLAIGPRWTVSGQVGRTFQSGSQNLGDNLAFVASQGVQLARRNAQLPDIGIVGAVSPAGAGIADRWNVRAAINASYDRTNFSAALFSTFSAEDDDEAGAPGAQDRTGANASLRRRINRRLTATASVSAQDNQGGGLARGGFSEQLVGLNANYALSQEIALTAGYQHLRRDFDSDSGDAPIDLLTGTLLDTEVNQLRAGVRFVF